MSQNEVSLAQVYEGWEGHNESLVKAIHPLTAGQLNWRPLDGFRTVGEVARHISLARVGWFSRMDAPRSAAIIERIEVWEEDRDGNQHIVEEQVAIAEDADALTAWLNLTWGMIAATLDAWSVADLSKSYRHMWNGDAYANTRQWTIYRILTHDVHHGGELSLMLGMQGIEAFELSDLFGHLALPPLYED